MPDFEALIRATIDTSNAESQIKGLEKTTVTLKNFTLDTSGLPNQIQGSLDKHKFTISLDGIKGTNLDTQMRNIGNRAGQTLSERINANLANGKYQASIAKVTADFERLGSTGHTQLSQVKTDIEALNTLYQNMSKASTTDVLVKEYNEFDTTLQRVKNTLSVVNSENKTFASSFQIQQLDNKLATWLEKNSKAAKDFGGSINELRSELSRMEAAGNGTESELKQIEQRFKEIDIAASSAGKKGHTLKDTFKGGLESISKYVSISTVIYKSIEALRQMYQNVYDIDTEMTELKKVTDETAESYQKFLSGAGTVSKEIGTTIKDLISSTADFARLGYNFTDSQELARVANIYNVVGDEIGSIDEATKSVISTMAAFQDGTNGVVSNGEFAMSIIDKFNEVGNNFAISSGGIGEALTRSASSLAAANNTLDESIALITSANTVVQDPAAVGTAFKTISMRVRAAKTELEEAQLDTEGMATSTAKLREEIMALSGVDIMLDDKTFKGTYQLMDDLSKKWKDLSDVQRASITELLAGKRQGNIFSALMSNFDVAQEALQTSMNSSGSAMAEEQKWLESLEAKTKQFQAAWEELSQSLMDDGFLKNLVDAGTDILSTITGITDKVGTLPTLIAGIAAVLSFKNIGRTKMFVLLDMPIVVIVLFRYKQFRYYG